MLTKKSLCMERQVKGTVHRDGSGWKWYQSKGLHKWVRRGYFQLISFVSHPVRGSLSFCATSYKYRNIWSQYPMAHLNAFIAPLWNSLLSPACRTKFCTVICCPALPCIVLQSPVLCCAVLHCPALSYKVLHCVVLSCTVLHCPALNSCIWFSPWVSL